MITFRRLKFENRNWAECEPDLQLANSSVCHPENVPSKNPFSLSNSIGIRFLARLVMTIKNAGLRTTLAPIRSRRIHGLFASSFLSSLRTALAPILSRCLCVAVLSFFAFPSSSPAQTIDKPAQTIDEDITAFTFAPDGRMVLVQLLTSTIMNESSHQLDEPMTLVLDESGREIRLSGDNAVIHEAKDATWLSDNQTIVYLSEAVKPNLLFSFRYANVRT